MRLAFGRSVAQNLLDNRLQSGMIEEHAIYLHSGCDSAVIKRVGEINQGLPESDVGNTGSVGQEKEELEILDTRRKKNPKQKKKPGIAYDG